MAQQPFYVAFDLDETLGSFGAPATHLIFLDPVSYYETNPSVRPFTPSDDLVQKLDTALKQFATCLASSEAGRRCLRPGIVDIVKYLSVQQDAGNVKKIVVYSNNGNLACLKLATQMIEHLVGKPGIFCDHIHYFHPIRVPHNTPNYLRPGSASKTFKVFQKLFSQKCGEAANEQSIQPRNCIFFDDIQHFDLLSKLPPTNYFRVEPYKKDTDFQSINTCFREALQSVLLQENEEYFRFIAPFIGFKQPLSVNVANLTKLLDNDSAKYRLHDKEFVDDTSLILQGLHTIFDSLPTPAVPSATGNSQDITYGNNYFPVVDGGAKKRKKTLKLRKKQKKRKSYRKSN